MSHSPLSFALVTVVALVVGCGGETLPNPNGTDAGGGDADAQAPIGTCHGFCPQPNGSACSSDCDCYAKCIGGTCADPTAPTLSCGDAAACPAGQQCGPYGTCFGATCKLTSDCPLEQQCSAGTCAAILCI